MRANVGLAFMLIARHHHNVACAAGVQSRIEARRRFMDCLRRTRRNAQIAIRATAPADFLCGNIDVFRACIGAIRTGIFALHRIQTILVKAHRMALVGSIAQRVKCNIIDRAMNPPYSRPKYSHTRTICMVTQYTPHRRAHATQATSKKARFAQVLLHYSTSPIDNCGKHQIRSSQNTGVLAPAPKTCADRAIFQSTIEIEWRHGKTPRRLQQWCRRQPPNRPHRQQVPGQERPPGEVRGTPRHRAIRIDRKFGRNRRLAIMGFHLHVHSLTSRKGRHNPVQFMATQPCDESSVRGPTTTWLAAIFLPSTK